MDVKEGSVFSLQIWGSVIIFPNFNVAGLKKYLLQYFSKNIIGKFKIKMQYLVSTKTPTMENLSITR